MNKRTTDPAVELDAEGAARLGGLVEARLDSDGTRRHFLKTVGVAAAAAGAAGCGATENPTFEAFFQQHYTRLTD